MPPREAGVYGFGIPWRYGCGRRHLRGGDYFASRRSGRLVAGRAEDLVAAWPQERDILITGATGFIGSRLVQALAGAGHRVTVLTRDRAKAAKLTPPFRLVTSLDQIPHDAAIDTIVNLAGEPIAEAPWTAARRRKLLRSRLKVTRDVVRLVDRLDTAPALLISGSAIGWYGLWQDQALTERDSGRDCFCRRVCVAWERMAMRAQSRGVRVVRLRIGLVLGTQGGMLSRLLTPFEFGLGGPIGNGRQWMSWIERDDLVRLIAHIAATPKLVGAVNATAPTPVRNADFTRELGRALRRPAFMPMPAARRWVTSLTASLAGSGCCRPRRSQPVLSSATRPWQAHWPASSDAESKLVRIVLCCLAVFRRHNL